MSQANDHEQSLKHLLKKHKGHEAAVVETFYEIITNGEWDSDWVIMFLESAKGISLDGDKELDRWILMERRDKL